MTHDIALEFIEALPLGFGARLGVRGTGLSLGQKQRISIARALYRNPSLLVLDEATSSLDYEAEEAIALVLRKLKGSRTIIVIAHRPATIRDCDRLIRFDSGRIVDSGRFDTVGSNSDTSVNTGGELS